MQLNGRDLVLPKESRTQVLPPIARFWLYLEVPVIIVRRQDTWHEIVPIQRKQATQIADR